MTNSESKMTEIVYGMLKQRGIDVKNIADIVFFLQNPYYPELLMVQCVEAVHRVLRKREIQYVIMTGIALDQIAEANLLPQPLQDIVARDEGLYGVDEVMALGITNIYGTIGLTSFGYLDKLKIGVLNELQKNKINHVNTFLDDIVAAIAAAAAAKLAYQQREQREQADK